MDKNAAIPEDVDSVALKFLDLQGRIREIRIIPDMLDIILEDGMSFDSSNVGFTDVSESDMVAVPDPGSCRILELDNEKIAVFICEMHWPDGKLFKGDPRNLLRTTLNELKEQGIDVRVKPEYEFHLLDKETIKPIDSGRYIDGRSEFTEIVGRLTRLVSKLDMRVEKIHHEAGAGQYEIEPMPYDDTLKAADDFIFVKDLVKREAEKLGAIATFMPKPVMGDAGNGMHVHLSLIKDGEYLFSPEELNSEAKGFVGGLLEHAKALSAVCSPTVNSYRRLIPGYEAPVYISWGGENRSVLVRIPAYGNKEESKGRVEFRAGDATANIYLMLNSLIKAGMDGIERGLDPGEELKEDLFELDMEEIRERDIKLLPESLEEALDELERDEVVSDSLEKSYEHYLRLKREESRDFKRTVTNWDLNTYLEF
ncbi:MAG: glutamine synthetase family protein [Candidatus Saliniplasma sp.]